MPVAVPSQPRFDADYLDNPAPIYPAISRRLGFEIKRTDAPRVTPSMRSALDALRLDKMYVVHAGAKAWPMDERIAALPLAGLFEHFREEREHCG